MTGKDHIIANTCTLIYTVSGFAYLDKIYTGKYINQIHITLDAIIDFVKPQNNMPLWCHIMVCLALYYLGTVLPDIDSDKSFLGRFVYIPIEHRTWTHAIWFVAGVFTMSYWYHTLFFLALGYLNHLIWDALSYCGVCFLYPFSQYRSYGNGAKVKKKHKLKLYRTGKTSEFVLIGMLITLAIVVIVYDFQNKLFL